MPTGYTADLCDGDQSFEDFVMGCAKAFILEMRDAGLHAKIPDKLKPLLHNKKSAEYHQKRLAAVMKLKPEEAQWWASRDHAEAMGRHEIAVRKAKAIKDRIDAMRLHIMAWKCPSKDHENLKCFMLEQLSITELDGSYDLEPPKRLSGEEWKRQEIESLKEDIRYYMESHEKELKRVRQANKWLAGLRKSLK